MPYMELGTRVCIQTVHERGHVYMHEPVILCDDASVGCRGPKRSANEAGPCVWACAWLGGCTFAHLCVCMYFPLCMHILMCT